MHEYKGYYAKVEYDDSIEALHGRVININDTITFEARSVDEAVEEFHKSVDDYLKWCEEEGAQPEKPYSGKLNLRLETELHKALSLAAAEAGVSLNAYINERLAECVE